MFHSENRKECSVNTKQPVNFRDCYSTKSSIEEDVSYAIKIGFEYLELVKSSQERLDKKTVLELGPGINFGSTMVLACFGANVQIADKFVSPWREDYHPQFYKALCGKLSKLKLNNVDVAPLKKLIRLGHYSEEIVKTIDLSQGTLSIPSATIDYIFSNAVLEHVYDLKQLFSELFRVSKPGAMGFHQIDFRDHRDFSKPLEYLLMGKKEFDAMFDERNGECGNQWRYNTYENYFLESGFFIKKFDPNMFADEQYIQDIRDRIQQQGVSDYLNIPSDILKIISGRFYTYKQGLVF